LVFQNKELGSFFNKEFISFRVTPSDDNWKEMRERFELRGTPTTVLLKPDGEELDRINGFDSTEEFVASVKDYLAGNNLFSTILAEAENNPENVEANFKLAKKYSSRWEYPKAYPYFAKILELDPEDTKGYKTEASLRVAEFKINSRENPDPEPLKQFIATNTKEEFMYSSYNTLARYYQTQKQNDMVLSTWEEALAKLPDKPNVMNEYAVTVFNLRAEDQYDKAKELAEKALNSGDEDSRFLGYYNVITYYRLKKDNDSALAKYEEAIKNVPKEPFFMYGYATVVMRDKIADKYDRAIELAKEAIAINEGAAYYWDTLGSLYLEKGERAEAVKAMEKALEIRPENKVYQQKLEKYRGQTEK
jgi:tetratricopeptide (TPR) repeat protein